MDPEQPEPLEQLEQAPAAAAVTLERRDSYRVHYPIEERPRLVLANGKTYPVQDLSERGLRYLAPQPFTGNLQDAVHGVLQLHDGRSVPIEGQVVRADERNVAVQLTKPIPFGILISEQRYLRKKYLLWQ